MIGLETAKVLESVERYLKVSFYNSSTNFLIKIICNAEVGEF